MTFTNKKRLLYLLPVASLLLSLYVDSASIGRALIFASMLSGYLLWKDRQSDFARLASESIIFFLIAGMAYYLADNSFVRDKTNDVWWLKYAVLFISLAVCIVVKIRMKGK